MTKTKVARSKVRSLGLQVFAVPQYHIHVREGSGGANMHTDLQSGITLAECLPNPPESFRLWLHNQVWDPIGPVELWKLNWTSSSENHS